eukprot:scaffold673770_cov42-Prasinocladus_malaysianus.AAC.1
MEQLHAGDVEALHHGVKHRASSPGLQGGRLDDPQHRVAAIVAWRDRVGPKEEVGLCGRRVRGV